METVENLMVGEHAAAGEMVHESFVERAFHGGEFYLVAAVGEDVAQSLELFFGVGEDVDCISVVDEAGERFGYEVEVFVV